MSKNGKLELSRRKALASLGAIGVASAGAGLGTSAYFSDEESFESNSLAAGELDLKVDWQQTYNGPIPDSSGAVGEHPVNAYPDTDSDGVQDLDGVSYSGAGDIADPVFDAADVPACCDCGEDEYYLKYAGETFCIEPLSSEDVVGNFYDYDDSSGVYSSLNDSIQREDTTFVFLYEDDDENLSLVVVNDDRENDNGGSAASFTIEGAPSGADWITLDGTTGDEWIVKDDEEGDTDSGFDEYAIAEADWVWTQNRTDGGALGYLADNFALRISAQLNDAADLSDSSARGSGQIEDFVFLSGGSGLDDGSEEIVLESGIGEDENNELGPITIHSACGIESGDDLPDTVFGSEYYPEQEHLIELDDVKPGDRGEVTFSLHLCDNPGYVWLTASNFEETGGSLTEPEQVVINESDPESVTENDDLGHLADNVEVRLWYDEDCDNQYDEEEKDSIFSGTLSEFISNELDNTGDLDFDGVLPLDSDTSSGTVECFQPEQGFCIGFEWWVPTEVGNIIQGDTVEFDLGFYTEQCRHNDGPDEETETEAPT